MVTIHYHRYDGDYEGVRIWTWDRMGERNPGNPDLAPKGWDDYGPWFQFDPKDYGHPAHRQEIGFVVRLREDWGHKDGEDRVWSSEMGDSIWLIGGDSDIYTSRPDTSPQVQGAFIDSPTLVTVRLSHGLELGRLVPRNFQLRTTQGGFIPIHSVRALDAHDGRARLLELHLAESCDLHVRNMVLVEGYRPAPALARGILKDASRFFRDLEMGAICTRESTIFRLFSPTAELVDLVLYDEATGTKGRKVHPMRPTGSGIWEACLTGDLHGRFYRYLVQHDGPDSRREVVDIHARCTTGHDGHGMIVDLRRSDPEDFRPIRRPAFSTRPTDAVIIEYSVRDLTRHESSGVRPEERGKFNGLARRGTFIPGTQVPTGIDHLVELGVTHVQLLPVQDFDNREDSDEYNWGYMTTNFSSPDGWFASNHRNLSRVTEFKRVVKALHDAGIRVIMDVVYNHTAPSAGFEELAPRYYLRRREDGRLFNGSGTGNEFHSEAPMARKFIVDSCRYWVEEYGVDGFRFDLMGLLDLDTMKAVRDQLHAIDPTLLLYGEPWAAVGPDGTGVYRITYKDVVAGTGIGAFNDHYRNDLKGPPDGDEPGFVQAGWNRDRIKLGIAGSIHDWAAQPGEAIQYATCHDNLCLFDKLRLSCPGAEEPELIRMMMLTNGILAVSQGVMFLHGGEEFARTKHGNHNSYNAPDSVNAVDWHRKKRFADLYHYTRILIALRRLHPVFRLADRQEIDKRLQFCDDWCPSAKCLAFRLDGLALEGEAWNDVIVLINSDDEDQTFPLPAASWKVYAQGENASTTGLFTTHEQVAVNAKSLVIAAR